jgi:hypothetical protein
MPSAKAVAPMGLPPGLPKLVLSPCSYTPTTDHATPGTTRSKEVKILRDPSPAFPYLARVDAPVLTSKQVGKSLVPVTYLFDV